MGSSQSVRATHFQRPEVSVTSVDEDLTDQNHISISNKMVERLVEDAAMSGGTDTGTTNIKGDYRENIFIEKLKTLDETHTERCGLTLGELNGMMKRIEIRTNSMVSDEPVCGDVRARLIRCCDAAPPDRIPECWETVDEFTACVQEAGAERLRARSERDARDTARRSRHVALAREHALRDLR